jgi:CRP-like cAMP-binding protein
MREQAEQTVKQVFKGLDSQTFQNVMAAVQIVSHAAGQILCKEGALERTFYILVAGEVAITKQKPDGSQALLGTKGRGEFFGEIALLKGTARTATVQTTKDATVVEMGLEAFRQVIRNSPEFLDNIMQLLDEYTQNHAKLLNHLIFTSYSRKDEILVKRLVNDLKKELQGSRVSIWLDQMDIKLGDDWDDEIEDALAQSTAMLLILSEHSTKSKNVKGEWNYCFEEGKTIIPVKIDKCKTPIRLATYHHIDLANYSEENAYQEGIARIAMTLREVAEQASDSRGDYNSLR